jgi:hypothetical protein
MLVAVAFLFGSGLASGADQTGSGDPQQSSACKDSGCSDRLTLAAWSHYDPVACKSETHGRFYIALSRNVLAVPHTQGSLMFGPIYPRSTLKRYSPPDPAQPEGCPNNPLQLESFAYEYWIDSVRSAKSGAPPDKTRRPDALELIRIPDDKPDLSPQGAEWGEWEGPPWAGEQFRLGDARRGCEKAAIREQVPNGMTACRIRLSTQYPELNERIENWAVSYVAAPETYKAPLGERFVVNCGPLVFRDTISHCEVGYVIMPQIGITYRFQPYRGSHPIPIDDVIDFDRGLRATIEASLVRDYPWQAPQ